MDRVKPDAHDAIIETSRGPFRASMVILAADAWINKLLGPLATEIPLSVKQEQITHLF